MHSIAGAVVVVTGLALIGFAVVAVTAPARGERFLMGFAGSARAHYLEQILRIVAGSALLVAAPHMLAAPFFRVLGWLVVGTSAVLMLVPWQWHHRFGQWAIPLAVRYVKLYALGAFALGAWMLYATFAA